MNLQTFTKGMLMALMGLALLSAPSVVTGKTGEGQKKDKKKEDEKGSSILRVPRQAYENIKNKVSDIEVYTTNYGIFGLNVTGSKAGGVWPRGSGNAYIFGGGVWFGAMKVRGNDTNKLSVVSYNPNSGASWMVPGRINGPLNKSGIDESPAAINKYRLYFSTDYNNFEGNPLDIADINGPNWPIWDINPGDTLKVNRYFGAYIDDITMRNLETFPKGPAIISGEDIFSIYKDTDLSKYERISRDTAIKKGYPIGIEVEQMIYSWGHNLEKYRDFLFIKYTIINKSGEDLLNCYMSPVLDIDIGDHRNDRAKIYIPGKDDDTLNLAVQWSEGEANREFGYLGCDFLESPAVDDQGFIRKDKPFYPESDQVGLSVFQNWPIEEDPSTPEQRYEFISDRTQRDVDNGPGDRRFLMSTGPFNMRPGDTARVVVGIIFANPTRGKVATGAEDDMHDLFKLDTFAQRVYDENFLAPIPPDPANVSWRPLNNGVELHWDDRSERSVDRLERGLDFAGYTIRRARRSIGFADADSTQGWNLGFKTIGGFTIAPFPDSLTRFVAARSGNLALLGPWARLPMLADTGSPGILGTYPVYRWDTVHHGVGRDSITINRGPKLEDRPIFNLTFDPFNDESNDSSAFDDGRYGDQFKRKATRDIIHDAIIAIMDSITDGRRFVDVGDDNNDGRIESNSEDLSQNEKLINNVDYYYQVLAFDAGSDATASKSNSGIAGINEVRATPEAPPAGPDVSPVVVSSDGLGGIHNFRFVTLDNYRLGQLFSGDTIEFEFQPLYPTKLLADSLIRAGVYQPQYYYMSEVIVRSLREGKELMRFPVTYGEFTDRSDTALRLLDSGLTTRTTDTGIYNAKGVQSKYNLSYSADPLRPILGFVGIYKNTFSAGFDYSFIQFGDSLRFSDTDGNPVRVTDNQGAQSNANVAPGAQLYGQSLQGAGQGGEVNQRIPSYGQPLIEVEFLPGGKETISVTKTERTYTFEADYLNLRVRNIASYKRQVYDANGNPVDETVQYNYEYPADPNAKVKADSTPAGSDVARYIDVDKFANYAYAWVNADKLPTDQRTVPIRRSRVRVGTATDLKAYIGTPNRYYVGSYTFDTSTIRFTHRLVVNGAEIFLDYAGMGSIYAPVNAAYVMATPPSVDFDAGDKVQANFAGGTLGLPQPGGKVRVAIPNVRPKLEEYTDDLLDQVSIVPNPYLINHIGQPATTDRRIYINRLPEKCTIEIYTEAGELLQTLEHDATEPGGENGRVAVEVWDVLTKSNRQAQSQLLIFRITTPNGAETIKKVAVVVGGFRLNAR